MQTTVYQYFNALGILLYVGITKRRNERLQEHAETKAWWPLAKSCVLEHYDTRQEALRREAYLIEAFKPPYNTQHNPEARTEANELKRQVASKHKPLPINETLKERQRWWYSLPNEMKSGVPCVACNERPWQGGPLCPECHKLFKQDKYDNHRRPRRYKPTHTT